MFLYYLYFYLILRFSSYAQEAEQAEEAGNKRYFVPDDNVKQPIFGSKKYNPILQQFECIKDGSHPATHASSNLDEVSTMETLSEAGTAPDAGSPVELPGISTLDGAQPEMLSTETPTRASDSLRAQQKATKIWWQTTTTTKSKHQNKGGKKKSRRDDMKTLVHHSSSHNINEIY